MLKSKKGSRYAIIPKSVAKLESVQEGQLAIQYPGCRDGGNDEDAGYGSFRTSLAEHCVLQTRPAHTVSDLIIYRIAIRLDIRDICTWEQMKTLLTIISMPGISSNIKKLLKRSLYYCIAARGTKDALTRVKYYEYHENVNRK
ncbi:hypothetical protein HZH68_002994 [Vespula germanica]|uniref:Uncharacterized protein n=1 Tax=Vespula germanica TaxID=30212 RepID=A0A834NNB4_VESGE|nr:hypothetical protein HZH68_002994 [Vespula germanica]